VPLHMTKVAYGAQSLEEVHGWFAQRGDVHRLTTRYLPKRHAEMIGGSVFWILKHQLVARSPIVGFGELPGGRTAIRLDPRLVLVEARPKRAHQGWRYLEDTSAPRDLGAGGEGVGELPADMVGKLAELGLL